MFFYTFLLIASLLVALVIFWIYRTIAYNAGSVYKTVLSGTEIGSASQLKAEAAPVITDESPTPWGRKSHETPQNAAKTYAALPTEKPHWDWSGSQNEIHEHHPHHGSHEGYAASKQAKTRKLGDGWPHREEKLEFGGKAYKVTRKVTPSTSDTSIASKPWGW